MTHIFEVSSAFYTLVTDEKQSFDILQFKPKVGDTVIYQRLCDTEELAEDAVVSEDEISVIVNCVYDDSGNTLKKGFTAFGFKLKEA